MSITLERKVLEEAADWLIKMQEGLMDDAEINRFKQWLARSNAHRLAWQRAEKITTKLGTLPPSIGMATLDRPSNPERREVLAKLALFIAAAPVGWSVWDITHKQLHIADYRTRVGEQQKVTIADGSQITLNTDTAIDVSFSNEQRLIVLRKGEIYIETSHRKDPRPFLVSSAQGQLRALGTRFTVRQFTDTSHLAVLEGAVEVTPANGPAVVITAGQQTTIDAHQTDNIMPADDLNAAWTNGMLMADAMPLQTLCDDLSRFRNSRLRVEPAIANLAVSGAFPLSDTNKALDMLAATYPITVNKALFGYMTTLSPKD